MAHAARLNLRMQKELKLLLTDPPPRVSVLPLSQGESSSNLCLSSIEARIEGPDGTAYSGGIFTIRIQVPERYPFQPPTVTFATPIYHPNIDTGGRICLDILNLPPKGAWQPSLNISTVLTSIGLLLSEPNPDDGLMHEVSREYKYNRQVFDQKARSWTEKYAKVEAFGRSSDAYFIGASSKTDAEQAQTVSAAPVSNNKGTGKRICIAREKLSLKAAIGKGNVDDKENTVPISHSSPPQFQNIWMCSENIDLPKQAVPCTEEQPGKIISLEDSRQNNLNKERPTLPLPLPSQSQNIQIGSDKVDLLKQVVPCAEEQPGKIITLEGSHPRDSKTLETFVVLDSEDSEDEDNNRPRRSRLSLLRKRGWTTRH